MSEKDKVKFIKLIKSQRKLLLADLNDFNEAMDRLVKTLEKYRNEVRKSRIENFAAEHGIEDGFTEGDWIFDITRFRFEKQQKVTPPDPPPGKESKKATQQLPGKKQKKKNPVIH